VDPSTLELFTHFLGPLRSREYLNDRLIILGEQSLRTKGPLFILSSMHCSRFYVRCPRRAPPTTEVRIRWRESWLWLYVSERLSR